MGMTRLTQMAYEFAESPTVNWFDYAYTSDRIAKESFEAGFKEARALIEAFLHNHHIAHRAYEFKIEDVGKIGDETVNE